jgi:transcriptional regulator with XRE-family HTH domain
MGRQVLGDPADFRLMVTFLRSLRKWTQEELSKASGVDRGLISDYELGDRSPTRKTLQRLTDAVGLPYRFSEILLPVFRAARLAVEGADGPSETEDPEGLAAGLDRAILDAVLPRLAPHLMELEGFAADEVLPSAQDRLVAAELWEALKELSPGRRRLTVETERLYWHWALAERLCDQSVRAAAHRADDALELARLGLRVAELVPGSESWRSHLLGWVWAFMANARRVKGDLPGAEEGFLRSDSLLEAGAPAGPELLDATRPLCLKATLLRYQGRFTEALALLEHALNANSSQEAKGRILIHKVNTLKLMGNFEEAITELQRAEIFLEGSEDTRATFTIRHALAHSLWQLGHYMEAEARLPEVRRRAIDTNNELDLIRTLWLEGGVAAGLGRREQALTSLEQVRLYFNKNQIAYDAALVSLELAVLYLEEGRTAETRTLAEEMFWIFKAQGVHQEALAALRLFAAAATKEEATAELARRVAGYLAKARCQPELRFEVEAAR